MILELVQMLYAAHHCCGEPLESAPLCKSTGLPGYKLAHKNHPMTKWVRESRSNYRFTIRVASALCVEFEHRYHHYHGCTTHVLWLAASVPRFLPFGSGRTEVPQCMPDEYKVEGNSIRAYRNYYIGDKSRFAKWTLRPTPPWWTPETNSD